MDSHGNRDCVGPGQKDLRFGAVTPRQNTVVRLAEEGSQLVGRYKGTPLVRVPVRDSAKRVLHSFSHTGSGDALLKRDVFDGASKKRRVPQPKVKHPIFRGVLGLPKGRKIALLEVNNRAKVFFGGDVVKGVEGIGIPEEWLLPEEDGDTLNPADILDRPLEPEEEFCFRVRDRLLRPDTKVLCSSRCDVRDVPCWDKLSWCPCQDLDEELSERKGLRDDGNLVIIPDPPRKILPDSPEYLDQWLDDH